MARTKKKAKRRTKTPSRRTPVVWVAFLAAMTLTVGLLAIGANPAPSGFVATQMSVVPSTGLQDAADPVFQIVAPLDRERWEGIVIHHLGEPAGDAESIHRRHLSYGLHGLGYHFVIGNGNGLGNGVVHVGYRWNAQHPGAHVEGPRGDAFNQRSIGICLVGNGDRRSFTATQMSQLIALVRRLQTELDIPSHAVRLHRDVFSGTTSPGRFFAEAELEEQLLD